MRILIVRLSHLGDVVHALGVHHALHEADPAARIAWAVQPEFAGLLEGLPGLERVVPFGRRDGWRAWPALRRALKEFRPDLAVDCQGNLKSAGVLLASGARERVGLARADWREPLGARVLTARAAAVPTGARHAMDRMAALVRALVPRRAGPLRLDVGLSPAEREAGVAELGARLPREGARPALVHLSSDEDVRGWPLARWEALVRRLESSGRGALVLSGPAEASVGAALARRCPPSTHIQHWIGQKGLRLLASTFEAAAARGLALVGCDSGPSHLAAAGGLPVVLLAGPQDPARTGPWPTADSGTADSGTLDGGTLDGGTLDGGTLDGGTLDGGTLDGGTLDGGTEDGAGAPPELHLGGCSPHVAVRARIRPSCQPCLARTCAHEEGPVCMHRIVTADVLHALSRIDARGARTVPPAGARTPAPDAPRDTLRPAPAARPDPKTLAEERTP